jgi:hypothetical protein
MYNNFKEFNKLYHHSSYFGYFGKLHIYKYNDGLWLNLKKWESFAYKLNNEEFKSEVVSFDLIYKYSPVIFSRLFKSKSFYIFNKLDLSKKSLLDIRNIFFKENCPFIIIDSNKYDKNNDYIILNNYKQ